MVERQNTWTEGRTWLFRGYEAVVTRDGQAVEVRRHGGPPLHRFPKTVTPKELTDFIDTLDKAAGKK